MPSLRSIAAILAFVALAPWAAASPDPIVATASPDIADLGRPAIRLYTDQDGLPQNAITALARDSSGYLWVGTKDGAAFYNGRRWTSLRFPPELGATQVQAMIAASDGSIWFGTLGGGVARYSGRDWSVFTTSNSALPSNEVHALLETRSDSETVAIRAGTSNGVGVYQHGEWSRMPVIEGPPGRNVIKALFESKSGDGAIWAGSEASGVSRFARGTWTTWDASNSHLPDDRIAQIFETSQLDGRPQLVVASFGSGIARFADEDWSRFEGAANLDERFVSCFNETRNVDGSSTLWAGTSNGLARFRSGRWELLADRLRLPVPGVWSLLDTPTPNGSRTLWIGTAGGGLARWEMGRWRAITKETGLPQDSVYVLLESRGRGGDSVFWIGTSDAGTARYERGRWSVLNGKSGSVTQTPVCAIATAGPDGEDDVWHGSNNDGLTRLRGGTSRVWTRERDGLPHNNVTCLLDFDHEDGSPSVLAGTSNGLARIVDDRVELFDVGPLPDNRIQCLLQSRDASGSRTLWIGTAGGLVRYEGGRATIYRRENRLAMNSVLCIQEIRAASGAREVWAGTQGGGLCRLSLDDPSSTWETISAATTPGLPNDTVYQIRQDRYGRVYVCTNKGVARFSPRSTDALSASPYDVYVFTTDDGLPSNECNTGASMVDSRGRIWVGTIGGAAVFDPSLEIVDPTPKNLIVERAVLAGSGRALSPLAELEYDENHLVFQFSLLSFFREADTLYRTELEGLDASPSEWTHDDKKEYTSLPHGEYRFKVWGMDSSGVVTGPVVVPFSVKPALWRTWAAYLLYGAILAAIGYVAFRFRMSSLRRSNRLLENRIAARTLELANKVAELRESEHQALESERRARQSEHVALEASRAKSVFLANMSHELRTPLNAILGFVQLMERDADVTDDQRSNLGVISRSGEHLLALINDVLSLSKIEAGQESIDASPFDLAQVLRGLEEMFRLRAESKRLELRFRIDESVPRFVLGDEGKLRQILINLLGNAVKFTETGRVMLSASWENGRASFTVADTGCGMTAEELRSIFRAFVQTESGTRAQEGTGLGLVISRNFALLMDGDILVESEPGLGSTFRVTLALPAAESVSLVNRPRKVIAVDPDAPTLRVLVVDDVAENRKLLERLLTVVGLGVSTARNGREAVALWERDRPDIILMDVRMPVMDGITATREIRRLESELESGNGDGVPASASRRTPIIALTASAFDHDRERILEAGCDDYIPKPFRESDIFVKLAEHANARFVYEGSDAADSFGTPAPSPATASLERLMRLPRHHLDGLATAVTIGDAAEAHVTIDEIGGYDAELAAALRDLVRLYRFDDILELINGVEGARTPSIGD